MKKALIVGHNGQDGHYLSTFLSRKRYKVTGAGKAEADSIPEMIRSLCPDEIYYLAAFHHSAESLPVDEASLDTVSMKVHYEGFLNLMKAVEQYSPLSRTFYASSSHIFSPSESLLNENSQRSQESAYARSKIKGMEVASEYRAKGFHVCTGILFNHESPLRKPEFVTRKISQGVARISLGYQNELSLGALDIEMDWGFAGDYVKAMWLMNNTQSSGEYVVATGKLHTIRDFAEIAFSVVNLNAHDYIKTSENIVTKKSGRRIGDASKLFKATGWQPETSFQEIISLMVQSDLDLLKPESSSQKGYINV